MADNFQLGDSQKVSYSLTERDAKGHPVPADPTDVITVVSSDETAVTVVPDATPVSGTSASGFILAGDNLAVGVSITATLTPADGSAPLSDVRLIDVVAGKPSTLSFGFGVPVNQ